MHFLCEQGLYYICSAECGLQVPYVLIAFHTDLLSFQEL